MEPGEAVKAIMEQAYPFTIAPELPSAQEEAVNSLRNPVAEIRSFRMARMRVFERAAQESFFGTMRSAPQRLHAQGSAERTAARSTWVSRCHVVLGHKKRRVALLRRANF